MNIQNLLEKIDLFEEMVIDSGFVRDLEAHQGALQNAETQSNLLSLRAIAETIGRSLNKIEESGLPEALDILFPKRKVFTNYDHSQEIEDILSSTSIDTATFLTKLTAVVNDLQSQVNSDNTEIKNLRRIFSVYAEKDSSVDSDKAIISLVFKDLETVTNLKSFSRALDRWNRTLTVYYRLVKSDSPEDIGLVSIQDGSLDVALNIDVNVALDLVALFKVGLIAFTAYLSYKSKVVDIVATYMGNKKLIAAEKEREELLVENVRSSIRNHLETQHKERRKADKQIENTSLTAKYNEVVNQISEHIIKGNELKLLSAPTEIEDEEESENEPNEARELREMTSEVRSHLKELTSDERKLLSEKYKIDDEDLGMT